ncbi:hypothetical protein [Paenibacillus sp. NAIST15-1]|uniref:hypothetical protein n=1 Tax=Paenibacillus sp. NAIST15-1 TaxID=1605994 RepID=UPI00086927C6|nr:hypothetical protein [Paenibacillus sp. NAIST15-1]GAV11343.1 hypothetical protein PBN151_1270 [Paenibacillus sp. NAIST15-1]
MESALNLFGIEILNCISYDFTEDGIQYNSVTFCISSLKKYDGLCVEVNHDWKIRIWSVLGEIVKEFYIIENEEFKRLLYSKYPLK